MFSDIMTATILLSSGEITLTLKEDRVVYKDDIYPLDTTTVVDSFDEEQAEVYQACLDDGYTKEYSRVKACLFYAHGDETSIGDAEILDYIILYFLGLYPDIPMIQGSFVISFQDDEFITGSDVLETDFEKLVTDKIRSCVPSKKIKFLPRIHKKGDEKEEETKPKPKLKLLPKVFPKQK